MYVRDFSTTVFDCVPDEILKYLGQLLIVRRNGPAGGRTPKISSSNKRAFLIPSRVEATGRKRNVISVT